MTDTKQLWVFLEGNLFVFVCFVALESSISISQYMNTCTVSMLGRYLKLQATRDEVIWHMETRLIYICSYWIC